MLELGEHEDVSALHLAVGGDRDKFLAALEEARRQARPLEREAGEEAEQSATPYPTLDLAAFLAQPPAEPPWDWHGWYARGDTVLVAGDPGVGKSLVALALVVTAARGGGELFGEAVAARRTLYIDLESPEDVVFDRLRGLGVHEAKQPPAYVHRPPAFNLLDREGLARLGATVRATGAELVVIDSLRRAAPGLDENDSREVSILFSALRDLAAALGCTIIVIHHPRKPVGDAKVEALYAARGSGDLTGSVDSYLFFRKLAGGLCRIEHGKARRGREHEPVTYRIVEGEAGEPVLENVEAAPAATLEEVRERVLSWLVANPDEHAKSKVRKSVTGRDGLIDEALRELYEEGLVGLRVGPAKNRPLTVGPEEWADWADRRVATYWEACSHAASEVGPASGPTGADSEPRTSVGGGSRPSRPVPEGAAAGGPTTAEVADPGPEPHLEREEDANDDIPW